MKELSKMVVAALVLVAVGFGAKEAYAARNVLIPATCDEWNWCAPSRGGQMNCDECCVENQYVFGVCFSFEEEEGQNCVCSL